MPDELRIERLLQIYRTLCDSKSGVLKKSLINQFGVSPRTIERDIRIIEKALSLRIEGRRSQDNEWRYCLPEHYRNRDSIIKNDKTILLLLELALAHFKSFAEKDLSESLSRAITASYPLVLRDDLFYYHDEAPHERPPKFEDLLKLREAFINNKIVSLKIKNLKKRIFFKLYKIVHYVDEYYLLGIFGGEEEVHLISLHDIVDIKITDKAYSIPQDFSTEEYLKQAFAIEPGPVEKIVLKIRKPLSDYIKNRIWHPTQKIEEQKDGSIILQMEVPVAEELIKWILGYGDDIEVLEPEKLIKIIMAKAERIYSLYRNDRNCR